MPEGATPWPIWRLWLSDKGELKDIQNNWTLDEVFIANALLDAQEEAEAEARTYTKNKHKRK